MQPLTRVTIPDISQRHNSCQTVIPTAVKYQCEEYNYFTNRKSNYTRLKNILGKKKYRVMGKKIYECLACNKTFRSRVNCIPHLRNSEHHKNVRRKYRETLINPDTVK